MSEVATEAMLAQPMRTFSSNTVTDNDEFLLMEPSAEMIVIQPLEQLITWPPNQVDPWHRLCSLQHDCVMVVEFSEIEGPKPVLTIPSNPGVHFDAADFALWLLTADYQESGRTHSFSLPQDIQMLLQNEEQGIQTYAHHFTLFDIQARGFVRPFCLAYLTNDWNKLPRIFSSLKSVVSEELDRVKCCNRRLFKKQLSETIGTLDSVETQAISSYYKMCYDGQTPPNGQSKKFDKPEILNMRHRKLLTELNMAYRVLSVDALCLGSPTCIGHTADIEGWIDQLIQQKSLDDCKKSLPDLSTLCPCVFNDFYSNIRQIWTKFRHQYPFLQFLNDPSEMGPSLHLDSFPLLRLTCPNRSMSKCHLEEESDDSSDIQFLEHNNDSNGNDSPLTNRLLVSVIPSLSQLLFPLLTGQFMLVVGSELRRSTLFSLITKLRRFVPCCLPSAASQCTKWNEGRVPPTAFADYKLYGLHLPSGVELSHRIASNVLPFISVLDMNSDIFHSSRYKGRILDKVGSKGGYFDSDRTLILYLYSLIAEYSLLAYVSYYFVYSSHEMYRRNARNLQKFADSLSLSAGDMKIIRYFVEMLKQQQLDEPRFESAFESLFLEYEPSSRPLKLA